MTTTPETFPYESGLRELWQLGAPDQCHHGVPLDRDCVVCLACVKEWEELGRRYLEEW